MVYVIVDIVFCFFFERCFCEFEYCVGDVKYNVAELKYGVGELEYCFAELEYRVYDVKYGVAELEYDVLVLVLNVWFVCVVVCVGYSIKKWLMLKQMQIVIVMELQMGR